MTNQERADIVDACNELSIEHEELSIEHEGMRVVVLDDLIFYLEKIKAEGTR